MSRISIRIALVLAVVVLALGFSFVQLSGSHTVRFSEDGHIAYAEEKEYWSVRIDGVGGERAYAEFGSAVAELSPRRAHVAAHVFGEALYETKGLPGAPVCDVRYAMGCGHAFFGSAALDLGIDVFPSKIGKMCAQEPTTGRERLCLHGVGHGIVGIVGYETPDLVRALDLCETIPDAGNLTTGCWGGAFMEHNVQTLISLDSPERPLAEENQYEPCFDLPAKHQASCMYWLPTWWHVALARSMTEIDVFREMGNKCANLRQASLSEACVRGIGFRAAWTSDYEPECVAELCSKMSSPRDRGVCWRSAVPDMPPYGTNVAESVCRELEGTESEKCLSAI